LSASAPGIFILLGEMAEGHTILRAGQRLEAALLGKQIRDVKAPQPRHRLERWPELLRGRRLERVETHGKHLTLRFDGDLAIHSHLRMNGAWDVYRRGSRWRRSPRSAWLVLSTDDHEVVQFGGPVLEVMTGRRARRDPRLARLGPDILAPDFEPTAAISRLRADPTRELGDALLDQRLVAGIGNVYKNEALFAARVSPWRRVGGVSDAALRDVLREARNQMLAWVAGKARVGRVYRRAGRACPSCGTRIRSRGQGDNNRITYWCERCQPRR
jgi:endonuclease-8